MNCTRRILQRCSFHLNDLNIIIIYHDELIMFILGHDEAESSSHTLIRLILSFILVLVLALAIALALVLVFVLILSAFLPWP